MIVKKNKDKIEISFDYRPELVAFVKNLEGRQYCPKTRSWLIPIQNAHRSIQQLKNRGFVIDPGLIREVEKDKDEAKKAEAIAVLDDAEFESPLPLFPYQKVGATFLYNIGSGILGDDMGLGKTIQSLAVCEKVKAKKVLIFTPSSVKWQFANEIERFIPSDSSNVVLSGSKIDRNKLWQKDVRFYICNYELLLRDFDLMNMIEWDMIIADEATKISNPSAKQSRIIKKLRAKRKIAMTGTPISNKANEVWNLVDFTNPGAFGKYWDFIQRYCVKNQWGGIFGYQNVDELSSRLKRYMIRRLKVNVLPELPEKIETDIPFELSSDEKQLYANIKKEILFEIDELDINKLNNPMTIQHTLVKMTRLRQITDSLELIGGNTKSSKLEVLKELLAEALAGDRKAIVFTQFAEMADILERELADYKPLKISGKIKENYQDVVNKFNNNEEHKILIMTSAGQFGLNIQRASVIFHYDQEWSLAKMQQRTGRAYRFGQKEKVLEYHLLAMGTVDMYVKKILHDKRGLSDLVLGDKPLTMGDVRSMLK